MSHSLYDSFLRSKCIPTHIDDMETLRWVELQEDRIRGDYSIFTNQSSWRVKVSHYNSLLDRAEKNRNCEIVETEEKNMYKKLMRTPVEDVIPGVGAISSEYLFYKGIINIGDLIYIYQYAKTVNSSFGFFCLFLRTVIGLDRTIYFRVALFAHLVSKLKIDNVHQKQD